MSGGGSWPNEYSVVGTRDALTPLLSIPDLWLDDHGQHVLDDGTLSLIAYATDAAATTASALAGVTMTLLITGDQREQALAAEIASRGDGGGVA